MFRLLTISDRGVRINADSGRLAVQNSAQEQTQFISLEDLDAVILEESAVSITGCALELLSATRIPVIFCNRKHLPSAVLNPVISNGADSHNMLRLQADSAKPWRKQLWQKLIKRKIAAQSANLIRMGKSGLDYLLPRVRSGDPDNIEARAAASYWAELDFFPARKRDAQDANQLFNYAYTILYSAFARYLCAAALNPDIGIHHHSQYNHFSLASDLMEPFRPLIDRSVFQFMKQFPDIFKVQRDSRIKMIEIIYSTHVVMDRKRWSLLDSVNLAVHSYKQCLKNRSTDILLPEVNSCGL